MSVVPYNSNNKIVLHDPTRGILVLHNNQKNTIQLLSTSAKSGNDPNIESNSLLECPNCGFQWDSNASRTHSFHPSSQPTNDEDLANHLDEKYANDIENGLPGIDEEFMHHDYFKVLSNLPSSELYPFKSSFSFSSGSLPETIFNQGYFRRFFKKVPPFILGSGAHAQVYKVVHVLNDIKLGTYAVKRICIGDKIEFLQQVLNEVMILYELSIQGANENNLIRYNHVWLELGDIDDSSTFILPENNFSSQVGSASKVPYVFILQQYCAGGHLEDLIYENFLQHKKLSLKEKVERERQERRRKRERRRSSSGKSINSLSDNEDLLSAEAVQRPWLDDVEIWKFFRDVTNGVHYLHKHGILHRDLKPSNCLLDSKYEYPEIKADEDLEAFVTALPKVLVTDFGEGKYINKNKKNAEKGFEIVEDSTSIDELFPQDESKERRGNTGTLEFTAPELWLYSNYDPEQNDNTMNEFTFESDVYSLGLILCWLCVGTLPFTDLISDETDPQTIRTKILDWYFKLNRTSFSNWFHGRVKGEFSDPMEQFEDLIYSMIRGDSGTATDTNVDVDTDHQQQPTQRILTTEILATLENMKFPIVGRKHKTGVSSNKKSTTKWLTSVFLKKHFDEAILATYVIGYIMIELMLYLGCLNFKTLYCAKIAVLSFILGLEKFLLTKRRARAWMSAAVLCIVLGLCILEIT
ncbi:probable serine/threonine-protein kinase Iks1p [[Candida] railenensis]|uniref:Probable serine/threonine-protein kinase Iks1p n=1 Tax=[Candida] railenensis TaxID=45579 RepID=A0A9P0VW69_9ASCO|nr:probable serine/threonine-protein kinase Iks1p [[Candida] railenensis]